MNINDRLFVEIHPMLGQHIPHPHPVSEGGFDPQRVYKVLGMYNASETSECYFILANPQRQIWFIPQRHLRAFALLDSDEFSLPIDLAQALRDRNSKPTHGHGNGNGSHTVSVPPPPARLQTL